ncbi:MAG: UDP-N-acetylmuramoyl-L-alanine--D-glutamate ligase [Acidobacteria bacterium]|nr:UDP-N-acetylmuramoyl-L-alanine--D-glutamate ligase [Acidobacteriota bacterium]
MGDREWPVGGRRALVVGAARSGVAAAHLLARRGAVVTLTDLRPSIDGADALRAAGVSLALGGHAAETFAAADLIVVSPGVPLEQPLLVAARRRGAEIIGELELAWRFIRGRVIAVTGTKGKSTTTTLVGRMLAAANRRVVVGGNIGVPLSAQVDESAGDTLHVVETSSFQLETTTTFRPWIAVWLNVADDHLDRHATVASYAAAKARIFANQTEDDWAVVNADDPVVTAFSAGLAARRVRFALSGRIDDGFVVDGGWIVRRTTTSSERLFPTEAVELTGRHMLNNVLAAAAAASLAGCPASAMRAALGGFRGLAHVMEPAGEIGGVRFVNDSKATNVEAARRSIESFPSGVVAIIGGRFKGGDLRELREPLASNGIAVVAIGEAAPQVHDALRGIVPVMDAASMREAVERAFLRARALPDAVVLLAPACASFDWFRDYAERGDAFKAEVARLKSATVHRGTEAPS